MRYKPCNPFTEAAGNAPVTAAAANPTGKTINKKDIPMFTCLKTRKPVFLVLLTSLLLILTACGQLSGPAADPAPAEEVEAPQAEAEDAAPAQAAEEAPQPAAESASLDGNWANEDPAAPGVTRMTFRTDGSTVYVQMWTHCEEGECAWDELGVPQASPLEVTWQTPIAINIQSITLLADGRLQVDEKLQFTDGSGRGDVGLTSYLVKQ